MKASVAAAIAWSLAIGLWTGALFAQDEATLAGKWKLQIQGPLGDTAEATWDIQPRGDDFEFKDEDTTFVFMPLNSDDKGQHFDFTC